MQLSTEILIGKRHALVLLVNACSSILACSFLINISVGSSVLVLCVLFSLLSISRS